MAHSITSRLARTGLADRLAALAAAFKEARQRRAVYNQTVRELSGLNERELADLGIHRAMIPTLAHDAAYGK